MSRGTRPSWTIVALAAAGALAGCRSAPVPAIPEPVPAWEASSPLQPLPTPPPGVPVDLGRSKVALTPEKVRLGRWLFHDPRLSVDGTVSCSTCHRSGHGFSEPTPRSTGVRGLQGTRKAPPILNVAFFPVDHFFWDGRAATLVAQAKGPIANPVEMGNTLDGAVSAIAAVPGYRRAFRETYGDDRLDIDRIADAIAAYETTRLSGGSAYDRFNAGDDRALSAEAQQGMDIFFGRGRCNACHLGPTLSDGLFHNVGVGFELPAGNFVEVGFVDPGRYAVTGEARDIGAFKTPTLRDVSRRAPYMHDGSSPDLRDAVLRYFEIQDNPWLDPAMREVRIFPFDVRPLVAFLEALDGTGYEDDGPSALPQ